MSKLAIHGGSPVRNEPWPLWPPYGEEEEKQLLEALRSHNWGGYPAPNAKARQFAEAFAASHGAEFGICCANGSVTLEMALRAAGIQAGEEVIVPTYTWIATAACAVFVNAVPVFVDVRPDNYTLDVDKVREAITDKTRAVISVHLGSSAADNDALIDLCKEKGLVYIEDCAHCHGGKWKGRGLGSWGDFGSFSFQSSKLMTAGEGGIVLTNTKQYEERLQSLANCGRKEFGYDSYPGRVFGNNLRITEFQAGVLLGQLAKLDEYTERRARNAHYLSDQLSGIEGITVIERDERHTTPHHYQYIWKYNKEGFKGLHRDRFLEALAQEGVMVDGDFYEPIQGRDIFSPSLSEFPMLKERYPEGIHPEVAHTPIAHHAAYEEACWLHYPYLMGEYKDLDQIVEAIRKIQDQADSLL